MQQTVLFETVAALDLSGGLSLETQYIVHGTSERADVKSYL